MGLKEILAAKKAAAEQAEAKESSNENGTVAQTAPAVQEVSNTIPSATTETNVPSTTSASVQSSTPANVPAKDEVLVDANGKPLSGFALVKRRKELAAQAALAPVVKTEAQREREEGKPIEPFNAQFLEKIQEPIEARVAEIVEQGITDDTGPSHAAFLEASPETKQAYSDLKVRIDSLVSLSDIDLKNAMTELKKALMQNTNAVALMLPSDIGQMVIALRKMTGVELAKAEEKKTGKKTGKKEPALTAEELENAFKEL